MREFFGADATGGFDEFFLLERKHLAAHNPGYAHPVHNGQSHEEQQQPVHHPSQGSIAHGDHNDDEKEQVWKGVDDIGEAHEQVIQAPAKEAGDQADGRAQQHDNDGGDKPDHHGNPRPVNHTAVNIPAEGIGAQQKRRLAFLRPGRRQITLTFINL